MEIRSNVLDLFILSFSSYPQRRLALSIWFSPIWASTESPYAFIMLDPNPSIVYDEIANK
jgi:hypothetical protein